MNASYYSCDIMEVSYVFAVLFVIVEKFGNLTSELILCLEQEPRFSSKSHNFLSLNIAEGQGVNRVFFFLMYHNSSSSVRTPHDTRNDFSNDKAEIPSHIDENPFGKFVVYK